MDYDTAMQCRVSRAEAEREIARHDLPFAEFLAEVGDHSQYAGADVLNWLGY